MYFPIGWPKLINVPKNQHEQLADVEDNIQQVSCNRDKIFVAVLTDYTLAIWFCKLCVPIVSHCRTRKSVEDYGTNFLVIWRPDSTSLVVATTGGYLLWYNLDVGNPNRGIYQQQDSTQSNLRRESAELFVKEEVPSLTLSLNNKVHVDGGITSIVCIRDELMVATTSGHILRYFWNGVPNRDYCLDLKRIPFCVDQQVARAIPIEDTRTCVVSIEYSPLVGGFAVVLSDGRAAFLTASSLKFDPNQVQGIWAQQIEDATCASVNHKYRLVTFGRSNSHCVTYCVDETTGALQALHQLILSSKDYPGSPGAVSLMRWTPDGSALAVAWAHGGMSLWSTFGTLLMCTLGWDYGRLVDLERRNPLRVFSVDWSAEGYQLWMVARQIDSSPNAVEEEDYHRTVMQLQFVKSALTVNPCMNQLEYLLLQGEDRLFVNVSNPMTNVSSNAKSNSAASTPETLREAGDDSFTGISEVSISAGICVGSKQWIVVPIPHSYLGTNWPIRFAAIDLDGHHIAVAGRTGVAHYSLSTRKWKLFGNESQERDLMVMGGLMWWNDFIVLGCYDLASGRDELRLYPRETKLDNSFSSSLHVNSQVLLLNIHGNRLVAFFSNSCVTLFNLVKKENSSIGSSVQIVTLQSIDITALFIHPACVISLTLTCLRPESGRGNLRESESVILNICGRLMMIQQETAHKENEDNGGMPMYVTPTVLASCVENVWVPNSPCRDKPHLTEALWLYCGSYGMRVWLPLFPKDGDKSHTFMSKRIMLPFQLRIYPLAILFKNAIILGAENDTVLYSADPNTPATLPFSVLERTSEVYLHQILRQLIRRNLGFHAWEIARSCTGLPYFPHSLELLLHEVLEEEATSKEPIPDALLPSVIEFIQEFPVYLQTVVQCARKTEIALWPYLFTAAGKPKDLFRECLQKRKLNTAASYLIILQNLEPSSVSRQYATMLLDASLEHGKWELSKDLIRFLKAIDPNDVESPRTSIAYPTKYGPTPPTPPVSPNEEDLSLILGTVQVQRARSFSTTTAPKPSVAENATHRDVSRTNSETTAAVQGVTRKKSVPQMSDKSSRERDPPPEWVLDSLLQRHARQLLTQCRLRDLGTFAAHLEFHLVAWLQKERHGAALIQDFVGTLKKLHSDFQWPYPILTHPISYYLGRKASSSGSSNKSNPATPTTEEHPKPLTIDVAAAKAYGAFGNTIASHSRIGDSGYMSHPGPLHAFSSVDMNGQTVEARLMPNIEQAGEVSILSEESCSLWGEGERETSLVDAANSRTWNDLVALHDFEQVSMEMANRGLPRAEVQLRYMLQMLMEAGCLEWSLLTAILLRDGMAVVRTINAARSPDQSSDVVVQLREGLIALAHWSDTECLGYKPFMMAIYNQVGVLGKLLPQKVTSPLRLASLGHRVAGETNGIAEECTENKLSSSTGNVSSGNVGNGECTTEELKTNSALLVSEPEVKVEPLLVKDETAMESNSSTCVIS